MKQNDTKQYEYFNEADIISVICSEYKVTEGQLKNCTRKREVVKARHLAMVFILKHSKLTFMKTGIIFNRDHASVINAKSKIEGYYDIYPDCRKEYDVIYNAIKAKADEFERYKNFNTESV